ncbi:hypothetical protein AHAS_Ahas20G0148500 [Arachis hypogaea]
MSSCCIDYILMLRFTRSMTNLGIFLQSRSQCLRLSPQLRSCTPAPLVDRRVWAREVVRVPRPHLSLLRFLMMRTRILRSIQM